MGVAGAGLRWLSAPLHGQRGPQNRSNAVHGVRLCLQAKKVPLGELGGLLVLSQRAAGGSCDPGAV